MDLIQCSSILHPFIPQLLSYCPLMWKKCVLELRIDFEEKLYVRWSDGFCIENLYSAIVPVCFSMDFFHRSIRVCALGYTDNFLNSSKVTYPPIHLKTEENLVYNIVWRLRQKYMENICKSGPVRLRFKLNFNKTENLVGVICQTYTQGKRHIA